MSVTIFQVMNNKKLFDELDLTEMTGRKWALLLQKCPEFLEYCDWEKLDQQDAVMLIRSNVIFSAYIDVSTITEPFLVAQLLLKHPMYISDIDVSVLRPIDWVQLVNKHPATVNYTPNNIKIVRGSKDIETVCIDTNEPNKIQIGEVYAPLQTQMDLLAQEYSPSTIVDIIQSIKVCSYLSGNSLSI